MNRRTVTFAAVAAVLLAGAAGAVRVALGHTPAGYESGYSPPDSVVLVGADGVTLWAGIGGCYERTALQALERPGSVLLRVSWRTRPNCGFPPGWAVTPRLPSLNLQVGLSAPLGGRRLVGPDGAALPRLDEAQVLTTLTARARARLGMYPGSPQLQEPVFEPMFPAARCLRSVINPGRLLLDQCAYDGAAGHALMGTTVTVRGRPGHLVDHAPGAPPWSGGPAYWYRQPQPPQPAGLSADRLFPTAKCLDTETTAVPIRLVLDQCAYGGATAGGPTAAAGSGVTLPGTGVTVRGQAGHVVNHRPGVPPLAGYDDVAWRALWWTEGHEIVVLISQRTTSSQPALLSVPELVAVADDLWCVRPAACRSPGGHEPQAAASLLTKVPLGTP